MDETLVDAVEAMSAKYGYDALTIVASIEPGDTAAGLAALADQDFDLIAVRAWSTDDPLRSKETSTPSIRI